MELREYVAVVGRRWRWLAACLLACLLVALAAALLTPKTWTAQTQVFVSSTTESTSPQFLQQRVKSYPDVASSAEVLDPVRDTLGLDMSLAALRAAVEAENPVDTSQINISVTVRDPQQAADIADAVAEEFSSAVERLETTGSGSSPVTLTVTNPAAVPTSPTSPQILLLLALGLVCGLGSGVAAAVVRDRWDTRSGRRTTSAPRGVPRSPTCCPGGAGASRVTGPPRCWPAGSSAGRRTDRSGCSSPPPATAAPRPSPTWSPTSPTC